MRVSHGVVALMGWAVVLGFDHGSAAADDNRDSLRTASKSWEAEQAQFRSGKAAYDQGNYAEAFRIWKPLADAGDEIAAYQVGLLYDNGQGVKKDAVQARTYMEKSDAHKWYPAHQWLLAHGYTPTQPRVAGSSAPRTATGAGQPPANGGNICGDMSSLDRNTRQLCKEAMAACMFGSAGFGGIARGEDAESVGGAVDACVNNAIRSARVQQNGEASMARCERDADKNPDIGIKSCSAVIDSSPPKRALAAAYAYRGLAYANKGMDAHDLAMYDRAIADADKAHQIDPESAESFMTSGVAKGAEGLSSRNPRMVVAAIGDLTQAIRLNLDPQHLEYVFQARGDFYRVAEQYGSAIQDYGEAIKLNRRNAYALYWRGMLETKTGDRAAGEADVRAARMINPKLGE